MLTERHSARDPAIEMKQDEPSMAAGREAVERPESTLPGPTIWLAESPAPADQEQLRQEAERTASTLRERFPNLPAALHVAAMMHAQFRQTAEAEALWQKCVELAPDSDQYRVNLAAVAMDRGNNELAVETLQPAFDRGSASPDVGHHLGVALTNLGRNDAAERVLGATLDRVPDSPTHWLVLGQAQLKAGHAAEAEASLRRAVELGAESPSAYFALANACARQGKQDDAQQFRQRFAELSEAQPLDPRQRFQILSAAEARRTTVAVLAEAATVHAWQQDTLEAERLLLRAIALDPASVASCRALANLYEQAGMAAEEVVVRRRLVMLQPQNAGHYLDLAKASTRWGDRPAAEAALKAAVAVTPDASQPYATLAHFYLQSGRAAKARWYAQEAVRREPSADGYVLLASTCRLLGDESSARAAFDMARQLDPHRLSDPISNRIAPPVVEVPSETMSPANRNAALQSGASP